MVHGKWLMVSAKWLLVNGQWLMIIWWDGLLLNQKNSQWSNGSVDVDMFFLSEQCVNPLFWMVWPMGNSRCFGSPHTFKDLPGKAIMHVYIWVHVVRYTKTGRWTIPNKDQAICVFFWYLIFAHTNPWFIPICFEYVFLFPWGRMDSERCDWKTKVFSI